MGTLFKVSEDKYILCESINTRNGFKHVARLFINGFENAETKICYLNRTWESFQYESVLNKLKGLCPFDLKEWDIKRN